MLSRSARADERPRGSLKRSSAPVSSVYGALHLAACSAANLSALAPVRSSRYFAAILLGDNSSSMALVLASTAESRAAKRAAAVDIAAWRRICSKAEDSAAFLALICHSASLYCSMMLRMPLVASKASSCFLRASTGRIAAFRAANSAATLVALYRLTASSADDPPANAEKSKVVGCLRG